MTRTQIYLERSQIETLRQEAARRRTTISDVIRLTIREKFSRHLRGVPRKRSETLLQAATRINRIGAKAPKDLASKLDLYLYGDK